MSEGSVFKGSFTKCVNQGDYNPVDLKDSYSPSYGVIVYKAPALLKCSLATTQPLPCINTF